MSGDRPIGFDGAFRDRPPFWAPGLLLALKAPIAPQALPAAGMAAGLMRLRGTPRASLLGSRLRAPAIGCVEVFASVAAPRARAFRYPLPGPVLLFHWGEARLEPDRTIGGALMVCRADRAAVRYALEHALSESKAGAGAA